MECQVLPIKIRKLYPPQDNLIDNLFHSLGGGQKNIINGSSVPLVEEKPILESFSLLEEDILCLSAKVVSIHQGRCIQVKTKKQRNSLVQQEAEYYIANQLEETDFPFTLKNNTPVPFAGIDESNGNGWQILWPKDPAQTACDLHAEIIRRGQIQCLGLIIVDSTLFPLRRGAIGIGIAAAGIKLVQDYRGQEDLFGRPLKLSEMNIVDRLASFASLFMGEGAEQTPAVILRGLRQYIAQDTEDFSKLFMAPEQDFYAPLFHNKII